MARKKKSANPRPEIPGYIEPDPDRLRIVPLGGLGEFGKNMMAFEYGGDMIIVDCGQMFPDHEMLGVDSVIPDFTYIADRVDRLRGIILTHGHEDHIGAIPYFLRDFEVPVYASRLTLEFVRSKLREMDIEDRADLHEIEGRQRFKLGKFEVELLRVTHSIPDSMAVAITLPIGTIIHTGDYKFDASAKDETSDFFTLSRYGEEGVLALLADSTNIGREGISPPEESVLEGLRPIVSAARGAVILSTFSSALHRVQTVLTLAEEAGRKVFLAGLSLERNFAIASKLGLLHYPEGLVLPIKDAQSLAPCQRLLIAAGSQGEPRSALSRLALESFKKYRIAQGDTVILSARMIPGNEKSIFRMINHFYRRGARVITDRDAAVHASGHAYAGEMSQLYRMLRPKYFVPIHGELKQLMDNGELAASHGIERENIFIMDNGDTLDMDPKFAEKRRGDLAGQVLVDGKMIDQLEEVVLRDRKHLAEDGMIIIILAIDRRTLKIIAGPDIVSRGFIEVDTNEALIAQCKEVVIEAFEACVSEEKEEWDVVKTQVRKALRSFLKKSTDRYPVILPVVMEV